MHLIEIIPEKSDENSPILHRLSIFKYPFHRGISMNSEQFGEIEGKNWTEYRVNTLNLEMEVEIGLEMCDLELEMSVFSVLKSEEMREEIVFLYGKYEKKAVFWVGNVTKVIFKIGSNSEQKAGEKRHFRVYVKAKNGDSELFPGSGGHLKVSGEEYRVSWTGVEGREVEYRVYEAEEQGRVGSGCRVWEGVRDGKVKQVYEGKDTNVSVKSGKWVNVLAVQNALLRSYVPYLPVHVTAKDSGSLSVLLLLFLGLLTLFLMCILYCYYRKRRVAPPPSLLASELSSLT